MTTASCETYQGNSSHTNPDYPPKSGKSASPIKELSFAFDFDNLFTSIGMFLALKQQGCYGTGTLRENMLPKSCSLPNKIILKNKERSFVITKKLQVQIYICN